ncbi:unnamed protein product [Rhizophagus irregularis]|nr:unnamed protein product [Rhizophagus irregularis]
MNKKKVILIVTANKIKLIELVYANHLIKQNKNYIIDLSPFVNAIETLINVSYYFFFIDFGFNRHWYRNISGFSNMVLEFRNVKFLCETYLEPFLTRKNKKSKYITNVFPQ